MAQELEQDIEQGMARETDEKALSVEEAFEQLEQKLQILEDPEISLEDAFATYQEGMKLLKHCTESVDAVEKKVLAISKEGELYEF